MTRARRLTLLAATLAGLARGGAAAEQPAAHPPAAHPPSFDFHVEARIVPSERAAHVTLELGKGSQRVVWLRFRIDPKRQLLFRGDGDVKTEGAHVTWTPPPGGGKLTYVFRIDHLRDARRYDARCAKTWAIFRGEDLVPPARMRVRGGARSRTRLVVKLPESWSLVTPYAKLTSGEYRVQHHRRLNRPTGWMIAGDLGVLREDVAGVKVAIAGPRAMGVRREDMLALLHWTLPTLRQILGILPERLTVVSAYDPMWRGGLSGPDSLFIHAHRPLISEDGPSPLLHEVMHVALGLRPGNDGDWAIEGLAQYYSLELLARSHTISPERAKRAYGAQALRGNEATHLRSKSVSGAGTARALTALHALDQEIHSATHGAKSLDDVVRILVVEGGVITTDRMQQISERVAGEDLSTFFKTQIP